MISRRLCALLLGTGLYLQALPAGAQTWSAQQILERISSPRVVLTARKGSETIQVDTIERAWVERTVSVTARLAPTIGVPVPPAYVVAGTTPNAHVSYDKGGVGTQLGMVGGQLTAAKFNRDQEREADDLGIRAMAHAGFDTAAPAQMWSRMEAFGGGSGTWMDTHPSSAERRQTLQTAAVSLAPIAQERQRQLQLARAEVPRISDPWPMASYPSLALTADEAGAPQAGAYRRGLEAQKDGRDADAVAALWEAAQSSNDPRAYAKLADIFFVGKDAEKNEPLACQYLEQSAALGFTPSIYVFGETIQRGTCKGGAQAEVLKMFTLAHQRGFGRASARLGMLHAAGTGVPKDLVKARALAQVAAERNDPLGKTVLGTMLRDGLGGPADPVRGFALVKEASEQAPSLGFAQYHLGVAYEQGVGVTSDREQAIAAYRRAEASGITSAGERLRSLGASDAR